MSTTQFVVLEHRMPPHSSRQDHYDLMLERGGLLLTWALPRLPDSGESVSAQRLADHRLAYLDYEGEVSGGRGVVSRHDRGPCRILHFAADKIVAELVGTQLIGLCTIDQVRADRWTCRFNAATS